MASRVAAVKVFGKVGDHAFQEVILTDGTTHAELAVTTGVATDWADARGYNRHTLGVVNGATNSVVFTIQGSVDATNWHTISYRLVGSGVMVEAQVTLTASSKDLYHLSLSEYFPYIRVSNDTSNAVGTTFTLYSESQ